MKVSEYQVLKSAAGYYIGRLCDEGDGFWMPYDRDSGYFETKESAQKELDFRADVFSVFSTHAKELCDAINSKEAK